MKDTDRLERKYVDKTLLIKDILDKNGKVNLFTRPRRFGKTLILSMLRSFFEKDIDVKGNVRDNSSFFDGMKIMQKTKENGADIFFESIGKKETV
ncbi:MAG: AAA family ATPase [Lachnospiraceae bacterium]|nr:AAA family ATPase [Lachnospiraceae bacterium]